MSVLANTVFMSSNSTKMLAIKISPPSTHAGNVSYNTRVTRHANEKQP